MSGIVLVLLAWLAIGFVRDPPASGTERWIVGLVAFVCTVPMIATMGFRRTLPALDRTPRQATVIGRRGYRTEPDPESEIEPYELVVVSVETGGAVVETEIADIVVPPSLDRFAVGSTWAVYVFEDPAALNKGSGCTRVILTEADDDVIRSGYDLGYFSLHDAPGPGSDLLLRRFANDRKK